LSLGSYISLILIALISLVLFSRFAVTAFFAAMARNAGTIFPLATGLADLVDTALVVAGLVDALFVIDFLVMAIVISLESDFFISALRPIILHPPCQTLVVE
jgi:hypothetical protein